MIATFNRLVHGFVAIPVILACERRDVLALLACPGGVHFSDLVRETGASEDRLRGALQLLESIGWLTSSGGDFAAGMQLEAHAIPGDIGEVYELSDSALIQADREWPLAKWLAASGQGWNHASPLSRDLLDGAILLPLLRALRQEASSATPFSTLPDPVREPLINLFIGRGWSRVANGAVILTDSGRAMFDECLRADWIDASRAVLGRVEELDRKSVV